MRDSQCLSSRPRVRPSPVSGSMSSEFTKSRKMSSRGSTTCSPVDSSGVPSAPPSPSSSPSASPPSAACSRTASLAKIRPPVRTARARASDGRESISKVVAVALEVEPGVVRLLGEGRDHDPVDPDAEALEGAGEEVVGQRPVGRQALELHRDRARLPRPDPDREVAIVVGLLEDDHVAAREHVDPDALDHHLDESVPRLRLLAGHGRDYPTRNSSSGPGGRVDAAGADRPEDDRDADSGDEPADVLEQGDAAVRGRRRPSDASAVDQLEDEPDPEDDQRRAPGAAGRRSRGRRATGPAPAGYRTRYAPRTAAIAPDAPMIGDGRGRVDPDLGDRRHDAPPNR